MEKLKMEREPPTSQLQEPIKRGSADQAQDPGPSSQTPNLSSIWQALQDVVSSKENIWKSCPLAVAFSG